MAPGVGGSVTVRMFGALELRLASLVLGRSEQTQEGIRAALERRLATYRSAGGRCGVPVSVTLAAGRKTG